MNTRQLSRILSSERQFCGVYACDELPKKISDRFPCAFIANTDDKNSPGKHWCAFFFPTRNRCEFLDSYGRAPALHSSFNHFLRNCTHIMYNSFQLQQPLSDVCGQFCVFFLYHRMHGMSYNRILLSFNPNNPPYNDNLVNDFVETTYNVDFDIFDYDRIRNQIAVALQNNMIM